MTKAYKLYLAGFGVFSPDAVKQAEKDRELCETYGFEALIPLDGEIDTTNKSKLEIAKAIFNKNISMIEEADIIIANVDNFRGFCIDDGTAMEIGYAYASDKPCYGYLHSFGKTYKDKMAGLTYTDENGVVRDFNGYAVENLDLSLNLMLEMSLDGIYKTLEEVLIRLKEYY